jgi:hypothetical protein
MWEFECKADLAYTSVTQFHILAINQCALSYEPQLITATSSELYDVMHKEPGGGGGEQGREIWL